MNTSIENRARVAFVVFLLLCGAAALAWYLVSSSRYATFRLLTSEPVSGLIVDAPVEFHGVEVGKVKRIELSGARSISILLSVDKDAPVTSDTVATITGRGLATRGFTGYVYVSLEDVGTGGRPLAAPPGSPFPVIPTAPSRSVSLDTTINQLGRDVRLITGVLQSTLDPKTIAAMKQSMESLERVARMLADNNDKLGAIIANAERASVRAEALLQSSDEAVRTVRTQLLPEAHRTLAKVDELTSRELAPLLQSSNDAVNVLQMQILPEAYRTLAKLDDLSTRLSDTADRIRRDPSIVIRGAASRPGPGETR